MPRDSHRSIFPSGVIRLKLSKLHNNNENICVKADPEVNLKQISRKLRILAVAFSVVKTDSDLWRISLKLVKAYGWN